MCDNHKSWSKESYQSLFDRTEMWYTRQHNSTDTELWNHLQPNRRDRKKHSEEETLETAFCKNLLEVGFWPKTLCHGQRKWNLKENRVGACEVSGNTIKNERLTALSIWNTRGLEYPVKYIRKTTEEDLRNKCRRKPCVHPEKRTKTTAKTRKAWRAWVVVCSTSHRRLHLPSVFRTWYYESVNAYGRCHGKRHIN